MVIGFEGLTRSEKEMFSGGGWVGWVGFTLKMTSAPSPGHLRKNAPGLELVLVLNNQK